jgi:hypothetical protein
MKITQRTRAQAALICAVTASSNRTGEWDIDAEVCRDLGITPRGAAHDLATSAWMHAGKAWGALTAEREAEAEAMLRTGWSPC